MIIFLLRRQTNWSNWFNRFAGDSKKLLLCSNQRKLINSFFQLFLLRRNNRSILRKNLRFFDDVSQRYKVVEIWYENPTHMLTTDSLAYFSDPYAIFFTRSIKLREASLHEAITTGYPVGYVGGFVIHLANAPHLPCGHAISWYGTVP